MKNIKKCNHDFNSPETTLSLLDFKVMTCPPKFFTICNECGEVHTFVKKGEKYVEEEEQDDVDE